MNVSMCFDSAGHGLGTISERWLLNHFPLRITADVEIESVPEEPDAGIVGIEGTERVGLGRKGGDPAKCGMFSRTIRPRGAPGAEVHADMEKPAYFEDTPIRFIKRLFTHHAVIWARKA